MRHVILSWNTWKSNAQTIAGQRRLLKSILSRLNNRQLLHLFDRWRTRWTAAKVGGSHQHPLYTPHTPLYTPYTAPIQPLYSPYTARIHPLYTPCTPPIHPLYTPYTSPLHLPYTTAEPRHPPLSCCAPLSLES